MTRYTSDISIKCSFWLLITCTVIHYLTLINYWSKSTLGLFTWINCNNSNNGNIAVTPVTANFITTKLVKFEIFSHFVRTLKIENESNAHVLWPLSFSLYFSQGGTQTLRHIYIGKYYTVTPVTQSRGTKVLKFSCQISQVNIIIRF